jgi:hypothetical protein
MSGAKRFLIFIVVGAVAASVTWWYVTFSRFAGGVVDDARRHGPHDDAAPSGPLPDGGVWHGEVPR